MKKLIFSFLITTAFSVGVCNNAMAQVSNGLPSSGKQIADSTVFKGLIDRYAQSIDQADTLLASKFWANTPDVSFIHPRGHEHGWNGVKNIYKMFAELFTTKKLNCFNENVAVYNDVA